MMGKMRKTKFRNQNLSNAAKIGISRVAKAVKTGVTIFERKLDQESSYGSLVTTASVPNDSDSSPIGTQPSPMANSGSYNNGPPPSSMHRAVSHVVRESNGSVEALIIADGGDHHNASLVVINKESGKLIQGNFPRMPLPENPEKHYETLYCTKAEFIAHLERTYDTEPSSTGSKIISSRALKVIKDISTAYMKQKQFQFWARMTFDAFVAVGSTVASAFDTEIVQLVLSMFGVGV